MTKHQWLVIAWISFLNAWLTILTTVVWLTPQKPLLEELRHFSENGIESEDLLRQIRQNTVDVKQAIDAASRAKQTSETAIAGIDGAAFDPVSFMKTTRVKDFVALPIDRRIQVIDVALKTLRETDGVTRNPFEVSHLIDTFTSPTATAVADFTKTSTMEAIALATVLCDGKKTTPKEGG